MKALDFFRNAVSQINPVKLEPGTASNLEQTAATAELEYMVNVRYNQREVIQQLDKYHPGFIKTGLAYHVKRAQLTEKNTVTGFKEQNNKTVSRYLCTTVARFLYLKYSGCKLKRKLTGFSDFYVECVNRGYVVRDRVFLFDFVKDEYQLMAHWMQSENYTEINRKDGLKNKEMINIFIDSGVKTALVRYGGHTFLVKNIDGQPICFDTWYTNKTGTNLYKRNLKRIKYIYWY